MNDLGKNMNLNIIVGFNKPLPNLEVLNIGRDVQDQIIKNSQALIDKFLSDINNDSEDSTKYQKAVEHALRRSIRGVGSSDEMKMAANYFNLILTLKLAPRFLINLDMVFNIMESELCPITNSKRDQREVRIGQIFVMSAILCSGMHNTTQTFDVKAFLEKLTSLGQETYLYKGIAFKVLRQLVLTAREDMFKDVILPYIILGIQSEEKSIFSVFLLLLGEERFPVICTPKVIKKLLGFKNVLNTKTIQDSLEELKGKDGTKLFKFLIPDLCRNLVKPETDEEDLKKFWEMLGKTVTENQSKEMIGLFFTTFSELLDNITDASKILLLLLRPFVTCLLKPLNDKTCSEKRDISLKKLYSVLEKHKDVMKSTLLMSVVERLLFCPGDFSFEKITAGKTFIRQTIALMKKKAVKKLAAKLRDVIIGTSMKDDFIDGRCCERPWLNKEKVYALHLLNRLLRLQSVYKNQDFKMEQLTFLTDIGFIASNTRPGASISVEIASTVRDSLYSAVTHRVPSLSDFQHMFVTIIGHIDLHIKQGSKLRVKFTEDMKLVWEKMMESIKTLDEMTNTKVDEESIEPKVVVFHPLFLQLALLLFKEPNFAMDCLKELQEVYHRTTNSPDYDWTGDLVELLLSLLSRNSQLHRNLIKCIFSHLCVHLSSENIIAVLRVLDPRADSNPLVSKMEANDESSDEESSSENENADLEDEDGSKSDSDEDNDESGEDDEEEDEDMDNEAETATDRLRQAVQSALGEVGNTSDNESVDVEKMDEDEGQRVDKALAKAFAEVRSSKSNKDKKQLAADRALTDFRLRVIDLLEVWLNTQFPRLYDVLDAMLTLLHLYGVCIMDRKQAPLVPRVRACLKKLSSLKKVSDPEDVPEKKLAEILSEVIGQENRSSTVYKELTKPIIECALMILRFAKRFHTTVEEKTESSPILKVIVEAMDKFLTQRNCQLQRTFFLNILKMEWLCNWYLAEKLPKYAFGSDIRPYMRTQALDLLLSFFNNKRLIENNVNKVHKLKLKPITSVIYEKTNMIITEKYCLQHKFILSLQSLIKSIEQCKINDNKDWKELHEKLSDFHKINLKKKIDVDTANAVDKGTDSVTTVDLKKLFNLSTSSGSAVVESSSEVSSEEENDEDEQKTVQVSKDITLKRKSNSSSKKEEPTVGQEKNKKRKKKHGKNKADQKASKLLRIEAGSQGLIDGCFSKLNLPTDIDGDDEYEDINEEQEEVNGIVGENVDDDSSNQDSQDEDTDSPDEDGDAPVIETKKEVKKKRSNEENETSPAKRKKFVKSKNEQTIKQRNIKKVR